jgi:hypothetical protein
MMTHPQCPIWIAWLAALLLLGAAAAGQDVFTRPMPEQAVASWAFDPRGLGPEAAEDPHRQLIEQGLVALVWRAVNIQPNQSISLAAVLDPGLLRDTPYRLVLLDLAIDSAREPAPGVLADLTRLQAVLEIMTDRHEDFDQAIRTAVRSSNLPDPQPLEISPGRTAQVIRRGDGVRELSWLWTDDSLLIGWGSGAISTWIEAPTAHSSAQAHRREAGGRRTNHRPLLEAFADLDRLRTLAPDEVGWGSLADLLHAWGISNARSCMAHAWLPPEVRTGPRLLQLDFTWSSRAEPTGTIHGHTLTSESWHPGLGPPPADATYAIVIAPSWFPWLHTGLATYQSLVPEDADFPRRRERWLQRYAGPLKRLAADLATIAAIVGPTGDAPPMLLVPMRPFTRGQLHQDLKAIFASVSPPVHFDAGDRRWTIAIPSIGHYKEQHLELHLTSEALVGHWRPAPAPTAEPPPGSAGDPP